MVTIVFGIVCFAVVALDHLNACARVAGHGKFLGAMKGLPV